MPARLEPQERLGAEEAEPADLLAADHALEQERRRRALDPAKGRDRREAVAGQLAVDRDAGGLGGPAEELGERGSMHGTLLSRLRRSGCRHLSRTPWTTILIGPDSTRPPGKGSGGSHLFVREDSRRVKGAPLPGGRLGRPAKVFDTEEASG